jgi:hypothetical protein
VYWIRSLIPHINIAKTISNWFNLLTFLKNVRNQAKMLFKSEILTKNKNFLNSASGGCLGRTKRDVSHNEMAWGGNKTGIHASPKGKPKD